MKRHGLVFVISLALILLGGNLYCDAVNQCDSSGLQFEKQIKSSNLYSAYSDPIVITNDSGFIDYGCSGDGSEESPYILEGLYIKNSSICISIANTRVYFEIRNCAMPASHPPENPAINFDNVTCGSVFDCDFDYHYYGVRILDSTRCRVANNSFSDTIHGVELRRSSECFVEDNWASSNSDGFALYNSVNCTLRRNVGVGSVYEGFIINNSFNCTLEDNFSANNGRGGYYQWVSDNITYTNNIASRNSAMGYYLYNSDNCTVQRNIIREQVDGIVLLESDNCTLFSNAIYGHSNIGVELRQYSDGNLVLNNTIGYNDLSNAKDDGAFNRWDDGLSRGNFWDDTNGIDAYSITGAAGSFDEFPLLLEQNIPQINRPPDYVYEVGSTGNELSWRPYAPFPYNYTIYQGAVSLKSGLWYGSPLSISIDSLSLGIHTFSILVQDFGNGTAADSITVMVTEKTVTSPPTTTTTESSPATSSPTTDLANAHDQPNGTEVGTVDLILMGIIAIQVLALVVIISGRNG
ncbi:MAG: nitrous oxide reductase family maturation protein NosD [Promethearchaeota archaeon]